MPSASEIRDDISFTVSFFQVVTEKYGVRAKRISDHLATQTRGKRIRSVADALAIYNRNIIVLNNSGRRAISTALKSVNYANMAKDLKKLSGGLGYYGKVNDMVSVVQAIITAVETKNPRPALVALETLAAGRVATALVAFAFSIFIGTQVGILGFALITAFVSAMVNDELMTSINKKLGL